ncbi:MAG: hypothetical protein RR067_04115 [Bacilli bacterium]
MDNKLFINYLIKECLKINKTSNLVVSIPAKYKETIESIKALGMKNIKICDNDFEIYKENIKTNGYFLIFIENKISELDSLLLESYNRVCACAIPFNYELYPCNKTIKVSSLTSPLGTDLRIKDLTLLKNQLKEIPSCGNYIKGTFNGIIRASSDSLVYNERIEDLVIEIENNKIIDYDCKKCKINFKNLYLDSIFLISDKTPKLNKYIEYNNYILDKYKDSHALIKAPDADIIMPLNLNKWR